MITLEERVDELEKRLARIEPHVNRTIPMGPRELTAEEVRERSNKFAEAMMKTVRAAVPAPVDRNNQQLVSGAAVPADRSHTELKANGQQKDYIVLTPEERAKGFVRPLRRSYIHTVCGGDTRMSQEIAETYARDPKFYGGTFCVGCGKHFPLDQFVWKDAPNEQVGS